MPVLNLVCSDTAICCYGGMALKKNPELAVSYLQKAVENGSSEACYVLGMLYLHGVYIVTNPDKTYELFIRGFNQGSNLCGLTIGEISASDDSRGNLIYFEDMLKSEPDNERVMFIVGFIYCTSSDESLINIDKGLSLLTRSALLGCSTANDVKGDMCFRMGDYDEALKHYNKTKDSYDSYAEFKMGTMYLNGLSVNENPVKAREYFEFAAAAGMSLGYLMLGIMNLGYEEAGIIQNPAVAANLIERARMFFEGSDYVAAGVNINLWLGLAYYLDENNPELEQKGIDMIKKAASDGDETAIQYIMEFGIE